MDGLSDFGGLGLYVEAITTGLSQLGHSLTVLTPKLCHYPSLILSDTLRLGSTLGNPPSGRL